MTKLILMDIEGTTTSLSFVHEVLFPYSKDQLPKFIEHNRENPAVKQILDLVQKTIDSENTGETAPENALLKWIDEDRKHPALKSIQGMIWEQGYTQELFQSHIYEDVPKALSQWVERGYKLGIYSSGSIQAQKLLFRYTPYGDLTRFLSFYFDTSVGPKRERVSYQNISQKTEVPPSEIIFLSDVKEELAAAESVGMKGIQVLRIGVMPAPGFTQASDFLHVPV